MSDLFSIVTRARQNREDADSILEALKGYADAVRALENIHTLAEGHHTCADGDAQGCLACRIQECVYRSGVRKRESRNARPRAMASASEGGA